MKKAYLIILAALLMAACHTQPQRHAEEAKFTTFDFDYDLTDSIINQQLHSHGFPFSFASEAQTESLSEVLYYNDTIAIWSFADTLPMYIYSISQVPHSDTPLYFILVRTNDDALSQFIIVMPNQGVYQSQKIDTEGRHFHIEEESFCNCPESITLHFAHENECHEEAVPLSPCLSLAADKVQ
ncbi:MAG: hypothetical protein MJZ67_02005 [Bacteroidales bacterium]|nr:hypothetical protein [Bacteroidales bacterium]